MNHTKRVNNDYRYDSFQFAVQTTFDSLLDKSQLGLRGRFSDGSTASADINFKPLHNGYLWSLDVIPLRVLYDMYLPSGDYECTIDDDFNNTLSCSNVCRNG